VRKEPTRTLDFSLKYGAIECVLVIACAEFGTGLNNFDPPEVSSVAHGGAPVTAHYWDVQHFRLLAQSRYYRSAVIGPDRVAQSASYRMRADPRFQHGPR
jgi:hypothetical protein